MKRRNFLTSLTAATGALLWQSASQLFAQNLPDKPQNAPKTGAASATQIARGVVFHDAAGNGARTANSKGVAGVAVSNGREVVVTDGVGRYQLPVRIDDLIFVIKPAGWAPPLNAVHLPQFSRANKPQGSPDFKYKGFAPTGALPTSIDFALRPQTENDQFRMLLFGDPQPRNLEEIDYTVRDVLGELENVNAAFGLSLGDVMFNNLQFYDELNSCFAMLNLPWYHTVGNHDMNYDSPDDAHSDETWKSFYGPSTYAFNYAKTHFIVLNNVVWPGAPAKSNEYYAGVNADQLNFVRNDLKSVPRDHLIVVAMHIPPHGPDDDATGKQMEGRQELYDILSARPKVLALSAHTHIQFHEFLGAEHGWKGAQPLHHLNHATVCGSWWTGTPDETGIPHTMMRDGAPNGYSFIDFNGADYTIDFKAARHPANHQMNIWLPDEIKAGAANEVVVNVFAGSPRSTVEMKIGESPWLPLKWDARPDPFYSTQKELEKDVKVGPKSPHGRALPETISSRHIWVAPLPASLKAGTHILQVRTKDMWNRTFTERRLLTVA